MDKVKSAETTYSSVKTFNYSVPQGLCNGPSYFCLYSSTLRGILDKSLPLYAFADDHTVTDNFNPDQDGMELQTWQKMELHLLKVHRWMCENKLKMNMDKTELIYFGNNWQL